MIRRRNPLSIRLLLILFGVTIGVPTPSAFPDTLVVNCYDAEREMVRKTLRGQCQGALVSDDEAARIKARRRAYVRQAIGDQPSSIAPGMRLEGVGSGFFVAPSGALLTNFHVVKDCSIITVSPTTGETEQATLLASDPRMDLALLTSGLAPSSVASFAATNPLDESQVAVVGYPNQGVPPVRPLLTSGTLVKSQTVRAPQGLLTIQADIRPGHSGGPVLDPAGNVVGVVFAAIDTPATYKHTGQIVRDIGVAIPTWAALGFLEKNRVAPSRHASLEPQTALLDFAKGFVARIECWN